VSKAGWKGPIFQTGDLETEKGYPSSMLLSLTTTHEPATDLGFLLFKNPSRLHSFELSFGTAHVFYPEAEHGRCTACLMVDVDPVRLTRGKGARKFDYVNDRPFVASSFLSVAIGQVYGSALSGTSRERPDLAATPMPLTATIDLVRCKDGEALIRDVFGALGYELTVEPVGTDAPGAYFTVSLQATSRLSDLLEHLYVLIPVLDDDKHYWVGEDEVAKLLRRAGNWLAEHPHRDLIVARYLKHRRSLGRQALARLLESLEEPAEAEDTDSEKESTEDAGKKLPSLHEQRLQAVADALRRCGATRVLDLGCGEGRLLSMLLKDPTFKEIVGIEVSTVALDRATSRLDRLVPSKASRIRLLQGSLIYRDRRLEGYDAAAVVEVIEHLDAARLPAFEAALFKYARPGCVVLTTPNAEYNARYSSLKDGELRHPDHRFEWTRSAFKQWCDRVSETYGYHVAVESVGEVDEALGAPSQMAVFQL
jgi:3' terminal RNA ribose 2'-O-methyltransferase Hen1